MQNWLNSRYIWLCALFYSQSNANYKIHSGALLLNLFNITTMCSAVEWNKNISRDWQIEYPPKYASHVAWNALFSFWLKKWESLKPTFILLFPGDHCSALSLRYWVIRLRLWSSGAEPLSSIRLIPVSSISRLARYPSGSRRRSAFFACRFIYARYRI